MILDVKSWCWMCLSLVVSIPGGGISTFGPLIIRGFGFSGYVLFICNKEGERADGVT